MNKIDHKKILEIGKYKKISLNGINKKLAVELYTFMLKLRLCEEAIEKEYHPADEMRCPVHFCSGEEAVPASLNNILESKDYLYSHRRSHRYYLAKNAPMKKLFADKAGDKIGAGDSILSVIALFFKCGITKELSLLCGSLAVTQSAMTTGNKKMVSKTKIIKTLQHLLK